jgi:hypothetical protein
MKTKKWPARWYHVLVDFGPDVQPWLVAVEATSSSDARKACANLVDRGGRIVEVSLNKPTVRAARYAT